MSETPEVEAEVEIEEPNDTIGGVPQPSPDEPEGGQDEEAVE